MDTTVTLSKAELYALCVTVNGKINNQVNYLLNERDLPENKAKCKQQMQELVKIYNKLDEAYQACLGRLKNR